MVKNLSASTGDGGSIPGLGREGNGNPLQSSCQYNPMHGQRSLSQSHTQLSTYSKIPLVGPLIYG